MKKTRFGLIALLLAFFPLTGHAWNESDHLMMTRTALEDVADDWNLQTPCEVRPLSSLLEKISRLGPKLHEASAWAHYLRVNPRTNFEALPPDLQGRTELSPLTILTLASIDPDDGRDQDLPYTSPDQKWFGSPKGSNSQAFRHIEKPPFLWRHPVSTFGFPFRALGEPTRRAEIYTQASLLAFSLEEPYWGWRLLGGALHYLEDLHQPYHAGQITPELLFRGLWSYLSWGRKNDGLMGTFAHLISNSHRFYESYVALPQGEDHGVKEASLMALRGKDYERLPLGPGTIQTLAVRIRDESNRVFPPLIRAVSQATTAALKGPYNFNSDARGGDNPSQFLQKGPGFEEVNRRIFQITRDRFESAGKVIRSVIHQGIRAKTVNLSAKPEERLHQLDSLLYPTSS